MVTVQKANKQLQIADAKLDEYLELGYSQIDIDGNVIKVKETTESKVQEKNDTLVAENEQLTAAVSSLTDENEQLKTAMVSVTDENNKLKVDIKALKKRSPAVADDIPPVDVVAPETLTPPVTE